MSENEDDLQVYWIPQIPMKPFHVSVKNLSEAKLITETLADYDRFQFENNIKPDYANAGGVQIFEEGEWCEWYDPTTGVDFHEWCEVRV